MSEIPSTTPQGFVNQLSQPTLEVGTNLGNFKLLRILGEGGMGRVYEAEDLKLPRKVAIKVMLPLIAQRPGTKERFLREARTAAVVQDDHIISIFQVDEDRGVPYIVMPLLRGESLDDLLERQPIPSLATTLKVIYEAAKGLRAAHNKNLIHRDIKPSNIWLEANDEQSFVRAKILDFGLAVPRKGMNYLSIQLRWGRRYICPPSSLKVKGSIIARTCLAWVWCCI